ncbi:hypothetical protein RK544_09430 [Streptococcus pneumoniae]|nr:hypothetical protein [Streptococcus pneumoniae]
MMPQITQFLNNIKNNNEYYSNIINDATVLDDIPTLNKNDIRLNPDSIISECYSKKDLIHETTNGTTDYHPLDLYKTPQERVDLNFSLWKERRKFISASNIKSVKIAVFYYSHDSLMNHDGSLKKVSGLIQVPMNRADDNQYIADLKYLIEEEIKWLIGPVSIFLKYAKICKKYCIKFNVEYCECTSEYVPEVYRKEIEDVFKCKFLMQYSCHELWGIAFTNSLEMYNVLKPLDNSIVEGLLRKEFTSKKLYSPVVTSLTLKAMPFIKYLLTDLVYFDNGYIIPFGFRYTDMVKLKTDTIHCSIFDNLFGTLPFKFEPLEQYQIIYDAQNSEIVVNVLNLEVTQGDIVCSVLKEYIKEHYKSSIKVSLRNCSKFFRDNLTGKMRGIINKENINNEIW